MPKLKRSTLSVNQSCDESNCQESSSQYDYHDKGLSDESFFTPEKKFTIKSPSPKRTFNKTVMIKIFEFFSL